MSTDETQSTTTADGGRPPDEGTSADDGAPPDDPERRIAELRARVEELETELERERRRRQTVIEQYERVLDDRRRTRDDGDAEVWDGDVFTLLLD